MTNVLRDASWDDLRVVLAIGQTGSLTQAARALGLTQPSVGRRLDRLEAAVGVQLVRRTSQGCTLSPRGAALLPLLEQMQQAADGIARIARSAQHELSGTVRIASGDLPLRYLARRLPALLAEAPQLRLELVAGAAFVSLERGDADLAVRNEAPRGDTWVSHRLHTVDFGIYATPGFVAAHPEVLTAPFPRDGPWIGFVDDAVRSARWLRSRIERAPDLALSNSLLILEAAAQGAGLALLPLYIGDDEPRLTRLAGPVDDLDFESVLVVHPSARRLPRVRWVASRLRRLFQEAVRR